MGDSDEDLARRLSALKPPAPQPASDEEILMRLQSLRGEPVVAPRKAALVMPPQHSMSQQCMKIQSGDARIEGLVSAFVGEREENADDEVSELLQLSADVVRFEAGQSCGTIANRGFVDTATKTSGDDVQPPTKAELRTISDAAASILETAQQHISQTSQIHRASVSTHPWDSLTEEDEEEAALVLQRIKEELVLERTTTGASRAAAGMLPAVQGSNVVPVVVSREVVVASTEANPPSAPLFPSAPSHYVAPSHHVVSAVAPALRQKGGQDEDMSRWCCICNDDAVLWCVDCENEPYCARCFKEGHTDPEERGHLTVPIRH